MSAGSGVTHSEFNHSKTERVHLLQIWIVPEKMGLPPSYEQKTFGKNQRQNRLCLIASHDARDESLLIHQDASIYATTLKQDEQVALKLQPNHHAWVQVARGSMSVNGNALEAGDGAGISQEINLALVGITAAEVLVFDLG
jgi:hypothetical protein